MRLTPEWMADALDQPHRPLPRRDPDPDALVRVMLSSGTTRRPKRVGFTWRRLELATLTNVRIYGAGRLGVWVPLSGADSLLGFSLGVSAWAAFAAGVTVRMMPQLMREMPEGLAMMTPRQLQVLLDTLPDGFTPCPAWRLQVGGSAIPAAQGQAAMDRITPDVWTGYGGTESSRITAGPLSALIDVGSVGVVPAAATVEIVDETARVLPDGEATTLIPAYAGTQASLLASARERAVWVPACAGMSGGVSRGAGSACGPWAARRGAGRRSCFDTSGAGRAGHRDAGRCAGGGRGARALRAGPRG